MEGVEKGYQSSFHNDLCYFRVQLLKRLQIIVPKSSVCSLCM